MNQVCGSVCNIGAFRLILISTGHITTTELKNALEHANSITFCDRVARQFDYEYVQKIMDRGTFKV